MEDIWEVIMLSQWLVLERWLWREQGVVKLNSVHVLTVEPVGFHESHERLGVLVMKTIWDSRMPFLFFSFFFF